MSKNSSILDMTVGDYEYHRGIFLEAENLILLLYGPLARKVL